LEGREKYGNYRPGWTFAILVILASETASEGDHSLEENLRRVEMGMGIGIGESFEAHHFLTGLISL
jgi:hypothetical protein